MKLALAATALVLAASSAAYAAPVTYNVTETVGSLSARGSVTTDGHVGTLGQSDITGFNFTVSNGTASNSFSYAASSASGTNGNVYLQGTDLSATATSLLFNFGGTDGGGIAFTDATASNLLCFVVGDNTCVGTVTGNILIGLNANYTGSSTPLTSSQVIGTVPAAAVTPEPSSLILLGTGALGAFATLRRRILTR